jgi:ribosomal protein S6
VQDEKGVVLREINPSARTLSYPIKKHASGFVGVIEFKTEESIKNLETKMQKDAKIMRHLLVVKPLIKAKKQRRTKSAPMFQAEAPVIETKENPVAETKEDRGKVELKDIEQKLDEILGE